jgi:hypothetical protein
MIQDNLPSNHMLFLVCHPDPLALSQTGPSQGLTADSFTDLSLNDLQIVVWK